MESQLRAALIDWLETAPELAEVNLVLEENPLASTPPSIGITASASADWSTKDRRGREVRVALELVTRADEPDADAVLAEAIEQRVLSMPRDQNGFDIANSRFLRARSQHRGTNLRATLQEFRFRLLAI